MIQNQDREKKATVKGCQGLTFAKITSWQLTVSDRTIMKNIIWSLGCEVEDAAAEWHKADKQVQLWKVKKY